MKIEYIANAGFKIKTKENVYLLDPWIKGSGFINSWNILHPVEITDNELLETTHIWCSHEHPDHFNPASLNYIADLFKKNKKSIPFFLFQETLDKRVLSFMKSKGFSNIECQNNMIFQNGIDKIIIGKCGIYDSWIYIESETNNFLHLNDCQISRYSELQPIKKLIGAKLDVLTSQYSYAEYPGSPYNDELQKEYAQTKVKKFLKQVDFFKPKYSIPSASSVHFSHRDNYWMNKNRVNPKLLIDKEINSKIVILKPNDFIELNNDKYHTNSDLNSSIEYFDKYFEITEKLVLNEIEPLVSIDDLKKSIIKRITEVKSKNNNFLLFIAGFLGLFKKVSYFVRDADKYLIVDTRNSEIQALKNINNNNYISINSYCLKQVYDTPWGIDALVASGRFELHGSVSLTDVINHLNISSINSAGIYLKISFLLKLNNIKALLRVFMQWSLFMIEGLSKRS